MDKKQISMELFACFLRVVNKYNTLGRHPVRFGTEHPFHHSERHMLDIVGDSPGINITNFAKAAGVTKGAISQVVAKLEKKGALARAKNDANAKEVQLTLTPLGKRIYAHHQHINEESINQLWKELEKHPEDKIEFLMQMFRWFESYIEHSKEPMQTHR
jgi:DNA-binding MarR family transcriptional regulator